MVGTTQQHVNKVPENIDFIALEFEVWPTDPNSAEIAHLGPAFIRDNESFYMEDHKQRMVPSLPKGNMVNSKLKFDP